MAILRLPRVFSSDGHAPRQDSLDGFAVHRLALSPGGVAHRAVSDAVNVAQGTGRVFVHQSDRVGSEDALVGTRELQSIGDVLGDVVAGGIVEGEAVMDARVQRAVPAPLELAFEFRQPDQDERKQRSTVPLVV